MLYNVSVRCILQGIQDMFSASFINAPFNKLKLANNVQGSVSFTSSTSELTDFIRRFKSTKIILYFSQVWCHTCDTHCITCVTCGIHIVYVLTPLSESPC